MFHGWLDFAHCSSPDASPPEKPNAALQTGGIIGNDCWQVPNLTRQPDKRQAIYRRFRDFRFGHHARSDETYIAVKGVMALIDRLRTHPNRTSYARLRLRPLA